MNREVVARASRPCVGRTNRTGETAVPLFRRNGSWPQCVRKKRKGAFHEPSTQIRMTNDEIRRNTEIRMTNPAVALESDFRRLGFGFLASFDLRDSSFDSRFMVPMHAKKRKDAFHVCMDDQPRPDPSQEGNCHTAPR